MRKRETVWFWHCGFKVHLRYTCVSSGSDGQYWTAGLSPGCAWSTSFTMVYLPGLEQARSTVCESATVPVERPATRGSRNSLSTYVVLYLQLGSDVALVVDYERCFWRFTCSYVPDVPVLFPDTFSVGCCASDDIGFRYVGYRHVIYCPLYLYFLQYYWTCYHQVISWHFLRCFSGFPHYYPCCTYCTISALLFFVISFSW